jgi:hypothetical protein
MPTRLATSYWQPAAQVGEGRREARSVWEATAYRQLTGGGDQGRGESCSRCAGGMWHLSGMVTVSKADAMYMKPHSRVCHSFCCCCCCSCCGLDYCVQVVQVRCYPLCLYGGRPGRSTKTMMHCCPSSSQGGATTQVTCCCIICSTLSSSMGNVDLTADATSRHMAPSYGGSMRVFGRDVLVLRWGDYANGLLGGRAKGYSSSCKARRQARALIKTMTHYCPSSSQANVTTQVNL